MATTLQAVYERSLKEPEKFWAEAAEDLHWDCKWERVIDDSNKPL